jgi:DNA-nicking Smr family endonuclease
MDDEDLFQRNMASLGVDPISRRPTRRRRESESTPTPPAEAPADEVALDDEEEDSLFLESMSQQDIGGRLDEEDSLFLESMDSLELLPDKDHRAPRPKPPPRKVKPSKRGDLVIDESLDLHGQTVDQALGSLRRFIATAVLAESHTVLVVTGKGLHSDDGRSVLRQAVEKWLSHEGAAWVRTFSEAPRAHGGSGAFVVRLS